MNILFDLDGTLTDSCPGVTRCIEHALRRLGRASPSLEALRRFVGPPLPETFAELLDGADRALVDRAVALYRERFEETGMFENSVYPGVRPGLEALNRDGHRMWVVTSKPAAYAGQIVRHFGLEGWLEGVYGSDMSGENGDKRRLIQETVAREGLVPRESWMVGDRGHDIRGARENGVRSLAVLWGYGDETELLAARPDHLVASMPELYSFFQAERGEPAPGRR